MIHTLWGMGTICGSSPTCYGSCLFVLLFPLLDWEIC